MAKSKETIEKKENGKSDFTNSKKIRLIISERLTALKESKNLSQKDMAEKMRFIGRYYIKSNYRQRNIINQKCYKNFKSLRCQFRRYLRKQ